MSTQFAQNLTSPLATSSISGAGQIGTLVAEGAPDRVISDTELSQKLQTVFRQIGPRERVLIVPPDATRPDAHARFVVEQTWRHYGTAISAIMPALGTHEEMDPPQIAKFFGPTVPLELFIPHRWESEVELVETISVDRIREITDGFCQRDFPVWLNRRLVDDSHDLIVGISQIVPHEVMGFAGFDKHHIIGGGGKKTIQLTHEFSGQFGIDRTLGMMNTPSRQILNLIGDAHLRKPNFLYVMLVRGPAQAHEDADSHGMVTRGVFIGNGRDLFEQAVRLSREVNITVVDEPLKRVVVFLSAENYRSFWLAMKGSYRLRLAMAEGGELYIVCPGVKSFGERKSQSQVISRYGYCGMSKLSELLESEPFLQENSGSWAHLTHGSPPETSPGVPKFRQVMCPSKDDDGLSPKAVQDVCMEWSDHDEVMARFGLNEHSEVGFHGSGDSQVYFGGNPAKGLWMSKEAFAKLDPV